MLLNADWHWPLRKVSRVNPEPFHSRKQRGSFKPHAGGSAVGATHRGASGYNSRRRCWGNSYRLTLAAKRREKGNQAKEPRSFGAGDSALLGSKWNPQQTVCPLVGLAGAPDEHKVFNRGSDGHPSSQKNQARALNARTDILTEMSRHGAAVLTD